jgi:hypothetical protein
MKCLDCPLKFTGQRGRIFNAECKGHIKPLQTKIEILDTQTSFLTLDIHTSQNGRYKERKKKGNV